MAKAKAKSGEDDILKEAKEAFEEAVEAEAVNRREGLDDLLFSRMSDQWPAKERKNRESDGRPVLTINRLPSFIRQVVNDARRNKPAITIHPANSEAAPKTAEIMSGLIRNIEYASNADIAYDTALEMAVTMGFGYFRINTAYADDDTFEQDIRIQAVPNPFSVYGDPYSTGADSSDWNRAHVVDLMPKSRFEGLYKGAEPDGWAEAEGYTSLQAPWLEDERIRVCEYWKREESQRQIIALSNGEVVDLENYLDNKDLFDAGQISVVGSPRPVASKTVTQYLLTGCEVLSTTKWAGVYIPIVPVYGEEVNVEGVRFLRSLVRDAKDPQRMFNYWRTIATELVALAPKAPFIGKKGSFETDIAKWETANSMAHAFIEYDGADRPERQPFAGVPAGALQEALNASDDMKAIMGIYNPALGAQSNEVSGVAINARKTESDTSNFNYIDNLTRSIRHAGRILIDLIPKVYSTPRIVRVLGQDKSSQNVPINQPVVVGADGKPQMVPTGGPTPDPAQTEIYDLRLGKYDLTVEAGPGFTTQREQAASQQIELANAYPQMIPLVGDLIAKNLDWPGADEWAKRLQSLLPPQAQGDGGPPGPPNAPGAPSGAPAGPTPPQPPGLPPEAAEIAGQAHDAITDLQGQNAELTRKLAQSQSDAVLKQRELDIKQHEAETKRMEAETDRLRAVADASAPTFLPTSDARPSTPRFT